MLHQPKVGDVVLGKGVFSGKIIVGTIVEIAERATYNIKVAYINLEKRIVDYDFGSCIDFALLLREKEIHNVEKITAYLYTRLRVRHGGIFGTGGGDLGPGSTVLKEP
jgi:hypothetical protein